MTCKNVTCALCKHHTWDKKHKLHFCNKWEYLLNDGEFNVPSAPSQIAIVALVDPSGDAANCNHFSADEDRVKKNPKALDLYSV